jgi:hypothetical protein
LIVVSIEEIQNFVEINKIYSSIGKIRFNQLLQHSISTCLSEIHWRTFHPQRNSRGASGRVPPIWHVSLICNPFAARASRIILMISDASIVEPTSATQNVLHHKKEIANTKGVILIQSAVCLPPAS